MKQLLSFCSEQTLPNRFYLAVEFEFRVLTLNLMAAGARNLSLGNPPEF
jgi:hypothetical protein